MKACKQLLEPIRRTVGDPVDVVTGASTDVTVDFRLHGPLPLEWRRYYDSGQNTHRGALGWGHTHEYDRFLEFDADGIRYGSPVGEVTGFPPLADGAECAVHGLVLHRVGPRTYQVKERGHPLREFQFEEGKWKALLARVVRGLNSIGFRYSAAGLLEEITDSLGRRILVRFERERLVGLVLVDPAKKTERPLLTCQYDAAGNLLECKDPYGKISRFRYDRNNRMILATDRRGYTFHYEYDESGRCVRSRGEDGVFDVRLSYHPLERYTVVTQPDGGEWTYFYNEAEGITQIIDPYGGVVKYKFDEQGRVTGEVDPNGNVASMVYDSAGGLIGKAAGPPTRIGTEPAPGGYPSCPLVWDYGTLVMPGLITLPEANDPVLSELPPQAVPWVQTLPGARKGDSIMLRGSPVLSVSLRKDDSLMRIRERVRRISSDPLFNGEVVNEFGVLLKEIGPYGHERHWAYDAVGNVLRYHDYDGARTAHEYVSWNHLSQTTGALGNTVSYRYTASEKVAAVRDPGGTLHEFVYDRKDRLVELRRNGVVRERYKYDLADNLIEKLTGDGRRLFVCEIGPGNRCKIKHFGSGTKHSFAYDKQGRLVAMATDKLKAAFAYDPEGNRTADERDGLGVKHRFHFDELVETTVLGRFKIGYRQEAGRVRVIVDPTGKTHRIRVIGHGIVVRSLANQSMEMAQYDRRGQCVVKVVSHPWTMPKPWSRVYYYSGEGDLVSVKDNDTGTVRYAYDALHRLTEAILPSRTTQSIVSMKHFFVYDAAGNLVEQPGLKGVSLQDGNRLASANADHFEYSDRDHITGRRGSKTTIRYHYDDADMLSEVVLPTGRFRASYDPLGRRTRKEFNDTWTEYYWDGDRLAAEIKHDGKVRVYVYAEPFALVPMLFVDYDSLDADPASGRCYAIFTNQIGTPVLVQDSKGATVWSARHAPYGMTRVAGSATVELNLRFPGHYFDRETGLHYNRYRYYSPELGRYLQSDPIGIEGGLNLYAYPASPLAQVDVQGLNNCIRSRRVVLEPTIYPEDLISAGALDIAQFPSFIKGVMQDLRQIGGCDAGQQLFKKLLANHRNNGAVVKLTDLPPRRQVLPGGRRPTDAEKAIDPLFGFGPYSKPDSAEGYLIMSGDGCGSTVAYNPGDGDPCRSGSTQSPSDATLFHELTHASHDGQGSNSSQIASSDPNRFPNKEEENTTLAENVYRDQQGLPQRLDDTGQANYNVDLP